MPTTGDVHACIAVSRSFVPPGAGYRTRVTDLGGEAVSQKDTVRELLDRRGTTYAEAAGIKLRNTPSPLYQLLVLTMLSATRISADVAVTAARELFAAGWRTPAAMRDATWQQRVDALGRGGYRRYDESTATALEEGATLLLDRHAGDLRRIRPADPEDAVDRLVESVSSFPRIGPVGARIFVREVQDVWPEVRPYFDDRALASADRLGLPTDPAALADLAPRGRTAHLAAALVREALES
jgi:hypothetical protein